MLKDVIGKKVEVTIDRPLGTTHPKHKNIVYPINYGYIKGIMGGDGEEQDAYVLGVDCPVDQFVGVVIAIIERKNDNETKWVVAPEGISYTVEKIREAVYFQERFFDFAIIV